MTSCIVHLSPSFTRTYGRRHGKLRPLSMSKAKPRNFLYVCCWKKEISGKCAPFHAHGEPCEVSGNPVLTINASARSYRTIISASILLLAYMHTNLEAKWVSQSIEVLSRCSIGGVFGLGFCHEKFRSGSFPSLYVFLRLSKRMAHTSSMVSAVEKVRGLGWQVIEVDVVLVCRGGHFPFTDLSSSDWNHSSPLPFHSKEIWQRHSNMVWKRQR
jgi:hypothetical protein